MLSPHNHSNAPPRIVIVGAAYAGLSVVTHLHNLCGGNKQISSPISMVDVLPPPVLPTITIIDERDGLFNTMGAPLALTSETMAERSWYPYSDYEKLINWPNLSVLNGTVKRMNPHTKRLIWSKPSAGPNEPENELSYDYLVVATGMRRQWPISPKAFTKASYLDDVVKFTERLNNAKRNIAIVGGGAVGIEIAGEVKSHFPTKQVILIHSRSELLSAEPLPTEFKSEALSCVRQMGVEVRLSSRVIKVEEITTADGISSFKLKFSDGEDIIIDNLIDTTTGHVPNTEWMPPISLDGKGFVKVIPSLEFDPSFPNHEYHFAAGDIVSWSGIKRVGVALYMGQSVATNILIRMREEATGISQVYNIFPEIEPMIAMAVGTTAVAYSSTSGVTSGVQLKKRSFGDDLGLAGNWKYFGIPLEKLDICSTTA